MAQITIEIPEDEFKDFSREQWEQIAREALEEKMKELKWKRFKKIISKSQATEKDVQELSDEIKENIWKHYKKKYSL